MKGSQPFEKYKHRSAFNYLIKVLCRRAGDPFRPKANRAKVVGYTRRLYSVCNIGALSRRAVTTSKRILINQVFRLDAFVCKRQKLVDEDDGMAVAYLFKY